MPAEQEETPGLLDHLEDALRMADEMTLPPTERRYAAPIRDDLIPALLDARTYVEVVRVHAPEVRQNLSAAVMAATALADVDRRFAPLLSRMRVLREEAARAAREL